MTSGQASISSYYFELEYHCIQHVYILACNHAERILVGSEDVFSTPACSRAIIRVNRMSGCSGLSGVWPVAVEKVPGGHREQSASDDRVTPVQRNAHYDLWDAGDAAIEFFGPLVLVRNPTATAGGARCQH